MSKSIFDYEVRINVRKELDNLGDMLSLSNSIWCNNYFDLYEFINDIIFPEWKYKGIFVDFEDFLDRMDIDIEDPYNNSELDLLSVLEILINLWPIISNSVKRENINPKIIGYFESTIPIIIEKLNYEIITDGDKERLVKRDADVDSIIECVPEIASLLLDYNDIRNNNIESKKNILKGIDLYIEENKKMYKSINNITYESIQRVVNELGVNHPIHKDYKDMPEHEICEWYDKCFKAMIHLIRSKEINEFNDARKNAFESSGE